MAVSGDRSAEGIRLLGGQLIDVVESGLPVMVEHLDHLLDISRKAERRYRRGVGKGSQAPGGQ